MLLCHGSTKWWASCSSYTQSDLNSTYRIHCFSNHKVFPLAIHKRSNYPSTQKRHCSYIYVQACVAYCRPHQVLCQVLSSDLLFIDFCWWNGSKLCSYFAEVHKSIHYFERLCCLFQYQLCLLRDQKSHGLQYARELAMQSSFSAMWPGSSRHSLCCNFSMSHTAMQVSFRVAIIDSVI